MKTIIQGKEVKRTYSVNSMKINNDTYVGKPYMEYNDEIIKWTNMFELDNDIQYNSYGCFGSIRINISEDEEVEVIGGIFRADLNSKIIQTDKIINIVEVNREKCEKELSELIKDYNKTMIESNERMLAYCKLNNLNIEETDADELKKVLGTDIATKNCITSVGYGVGTIMSSYNNSNNIMFESEKQLI